MHILKAMKRSPLGLDLYLWLTFYASQRGEVSEKCDWEPSAFETRA